MTSLVPKAPAPAIHPIAMALHNALQAGHAITIHPAATPPVHTGVPNHAGVSLYKLSQLGTGALAHLNHFAL